MKHRTSLELKLTALLIGVAVFLAGCSSSYTVSPLGKPEAEYSYRMVNEELKEREATIELKDGGEISAERVVISHDSLSWVDTRTEKESKASMRDVHKLVVKSSSIGALEGMGLGLAGGGGLGLLIGSNQPEGEIPLGIVGLLVGGGAGLVAGLTTGLIVGHSYNYEFPGAQVK